MITAQEAKIQSETNYPIEELTNLIESSIMDSVAHKTCHVQIEVPDKYLGSMDLVINWLQSLGYKADWNQYFNKPITLFIEWG